MIEKLKSTMLLLVLAVFLHGCTNIIKTEETRPNILFILVDDQRNDLMGCAGHSIVKTPTIDKLAENGIRFTNAFVTTSICAASRASIFTGLYECKHNYTFGKDPIKKEFMEHSYPYLLRKSGYNTGFVGKFGVKIEQKESMLNEMFDYYKFSKWNAPYFEEMPDGSRRHSAEIKGDQAVEYINEQSIDQPFCLSISFNAVHAVDKDKTPGNEGHYPYPAAVADLYKDMKMPQPKLNNPEIYDQHPDYMKNSHNRLRYFWRWDTEEKYQKNMRAYFRMISGYDNVIKRVLAALKEKGLDKNTVVIFAADNGYYMGNRGFAGKWSHYEESLRVPMIIYDPLTPQKKSNTTSDKMALNIDIPATILDYAGLNKPELYQGESLVPLVANKKTDEWRNSFFIEHRMENKKIPKFTGIRAERYVYANYYEQNPQYEYLHDLESDPDQLKNLVGDKDHKSMLIKLRGECKRIENVLIEK
ncbi:MAG: sulfatase [Melioribacteraceae bacterium]|nr:sulfatase [Melioribacteraceae bacterium]